MGQSTGTGSLMRAQRSDQVPVPLIAIVPFRQAACAIFAEKTDTIMFAFDNVLEYWATKYKRIKHDPAAKSKDKGYNE